MPDITRSLRSGFLRSCERFGDRPALEIGGHAVSYRDLYARAAALAATLASDSDASGPPLTAVFAHRSVTAFAGVLGALFHGHGYVPLNPTFPVERSAKMLERAGARALIVDAAAAPQLPELLAASTRSHWVVLPDADDARELVRLHPRHRFVTRAQLRTASAWRATEVDPSGIGYLLFTSGSTGQPKGVMVAHRNVAHFVDVMVERYGVSEQDRLSQMFDLTFDLSAFDMFVAWERGACVCSPTQKQKLLPASYVNDAKLSIWFSVPSTAVLLHRLRKLAPGAFPKLRLALFCGEALPAEIARTFAAAAPAAIVENLYGPTELTIACTLYRWDPERSLAECEQGHVPIGAPYPGMRVLVADEALREVAPGDAGELLMCGPQLSLGYWNDPERTGAAFVTPPGCTEPYYRTGDRVRRPVGSAPLCYLGRIDNQIKIQGYRVELGEIEAALREIAGVEVAIAVGWPRTEHGVEGIVAFIGSRSFDADAILARLAERLPTYMRPRELRGVSEFPLNSNGKVDRGALLVQLERAQAGARASEPA